MPNENITWKGYLGYEIPASDVDTAGAPEELKQNRINRDGTENFHVTVIGPPEVRKIIDDLVASGEAPSKGKAKKLAKQKILDAAESLMSDWIDLGLGKAPGYEVYFRVIDWPSAQQLRNEFGLPEKDFHITIGFGPEGDIHGIPKDSSTLLEKKFKLNEVANPIHRRPENIRDEIEDKLDILVDDSNIHGLGAFAGRHFSEDEPIGIVLYKLKSPKHASDSTFKNFCFIGNDGEPYYQTHFGDYLNHSKESNVTLKKRGSNTYGVAGRDIENGEELSIDYNHPLAPVDPDPSWDLTPKDIHNLADKLGVPWDNDPNFMDFSERATGKRRLDDMGHAELKQLSDMLKKQQMGENSISRIDINENTERKLRSLICEIIQPKKKRLTEKELRDQKDKRVLYHTGPRPAAPKPKLKSIRDWDAEIKGLEDSRWAGQTGGKGAWVVTGLDDSWKRWWLASPVKSGVFMSSNPLNIARFHGRSGNVYTYKVPEWVIEKSGGMHRYDFGSELLIPEEVWDEAGNEIEFLGKSMSKQKLWDEVHATGGWGGRPGRTPGGKPPWMTVPEWEAQQGRSVSRRQAQSMLGLRHTKHLEDAIKMMKPGERAEALAAFEEMYPVALTGSEFEIEWEKDPKGGKGHPKGYRRAEMFIGSKDQEIIDLLKKHMNESLIRSYITETYTPDDMPESWYISVEKYPVEENVLEISIKDKNDKYNKPIGHIAIIKHQDDCDNAWEVIKSSRGSAPAGAGTMLYDIALEIAGNDGLMADREEVSDAAKRVWEKIYASGATNFPLDSDCNKDVAADSPLSNRYVASGTPIINKLKVLNKWEDVGEVQEGALKDYIKSQIKLFGKERYNKIKKITLGAYWDQLYA